MFFHLSPPAWSFRRKATNNPVQEGTQDAANEVGFAQSEGWMCLAKVDESTVIIEYLRISLEVIPVEVIDTIR